MEGNIKIRPLFDNVVVKYSEVEEKSKTGIIVGSDENPALVAEVVAVGKDISEEIKIGDKIMYAPLSGRELGGLLILAQHDIMGVIEEKTEEKPNCVCTAACGAGLGHNVKMKCTKCGTEGYPKENQHCPNCNNDQFVKA